MWPFNSSGRSSAASMAIVTRLRIFSGSPGRDQTEPQANSVTIS